jgi:hypothetical protein
MADTQPAQAKGAVIDHGERDKRGNIAG